jgi:hypothetical protein
MRRAIRPRGAFIGACRLRPDAAEPRPAPDAVETATLSRS